MTAGSEMTTDVEKELREMRAAEHKLSDAYVRLRCKIPGALNTPHAPTPEQVYETTEKALDELLSALRRSRTGQWSENPGLKELAHFWAKPWRYEEVGHQEGPCVKSSDGQLIASLFWPFHSEKETARAENAMVILGRLIAETGQSPAPTDSTTAHAPGVTEDVERIYQAVCDHLESGGNFLSEDADDDPDYYAQIHRALRAALSRPADTDLTK